MSDSFTQHRIIGKEMPVEGSKDGAKYLDKTLEFWQETTSLDESYDTEPSSVGGPTTI